MGRGGFRGDNGKNLVKNFDSFEIDVRPSLRRSGGGVPDRFVCRKSFGGLESTTASTKVNTNQNQVSVQGGGANSFTGAVGGGNTVAKKGTLYQTVSISADPAVIQAASDAVSGALQFGGEVETNVAQQSGLAFQTINALAGQLTGEGSAVNPQTGDISTPAVGSGFDLSKWVNIALIAGGVASVLALIKSKGKNA